MSLDSEQHDEIAEKTEEENSPPSPNVRRLSGGELVKLIYDYVDYMLPEWQDEDVAALLFAFKNLTVNLKRKRSVRGTPRSGAH